MTTPERSTPAHQASFLKSLSDELVNHFRIPRPVVRQLRRESLVELVAAFRAHRDTEVRELMRAPRR